ncbi:protein of unassigned function [Methylobacterium oryzae CBMB20]|uniref:Protein of unassigned function n=1 Tax=Methylobacterium oryzae CBMB20 TaxID=693986 RepID=A0A089Q047_9HYPH|nr:protein of unassigned function [Methylobacterium oryzae CBMB20]
MGEIRQGRSEPLGADEGVGEVDEEAGGHAGAEGEVEGHGGLSQSRSQAAA